MKASSALYRRAHQSSVGGLVRVGQRGIIHQLSGVALLVPLRCPRSHLWHVSKTRMTVPVLTFHAYIFSMILYRT